VSHKKSGKRHQKSDSSRPFSSETPQTGSVESSPISSVTHDALTVRPRLFSHNRCLLILLLLGLSLRLTTITWGLPLSETTSFYHPDESKAWGSTVDFPGNYLTSENYLYGTFLQYTLGILLWPVKLLLTGLCGWEQDSYVLLAILSFRVTTALLGTATIWLIDLLGRRLFTPQIALSAAAWIAIAPGHVQHSRFTTLDVPMGFFIVLACLLLQQLTISWKPADAIRLGCVQGALLGTKITGGLFIPVSLTTLLIQWQHDRNSRLSRVPQGTSLTPLLMIILLATAMVFAISTPHVVLSMGEYLDAMKTQKRDWYDRVHLDLLTAVSTWFHTNVTAIGSIPFVLALTSPFLLTSPQRVMKWSIAGFCAIYFLFWGAYLPVRFTVTIAPLLCLLAASTAIWISGIWRPLAPILLGISCITSTIQCLTDIQNRRHDPRTVASQFIRDQIPDGTTLGIATDTRRHSWRHHQWRYPNVDFHRLQETHFLEHPEFLLVSSSDITLFEHALRSEKLLPDDTWHPRHAADWYEHSPPTPDVFQFYRELLNGKTYTVRQRFTIPQSDQSEWIPGITLYQRMKTH